MWPFRRRVPTESETSIWEAIETSHQLLADAESERWLIYPMREILREHVNLGESIQIANPDEQFALAVAQLRISALASTVFRRAGWVHIPSHVGFEVLARRLEHRGKIDEAIVLCEEATRQGWGGEWSRKIELLTHRLAEYDESTIAAGRQQSRLPTG